MKTKMLLFKKHSIIILQAISKVARGEGDDVIIGCGKDECIELMNQAKIKPGHILCMVRSFQHVCLVDKSMYSCSRTSVRLLATNKLKRRNAHVHNFKCHTYSIIIL